MVDLFFIGILALLVIWYLGVMVCVWKPFYLAYQEGKGVTQLYTLKELLVNMGSALIWPLVLLKNSG